MGKDRGKILDMLWSDLEVHGEELSVREKKDLIGEINKLEGYYKKDDGEKELTIELSIDRVRCPNCGTVMEVGK